MAWLGILAIKNVETYIEFDKLNHYHKYLLLQCIYILLQFRLNNKIHYIPTFHEPFRGLSTKSQPGCHDRSEGSRVLQVDLVQDRPEVFRRGPLNTVLHILDHPPRRGQRIIPQNENRRSGVQLQKGWEQILLGVEGHFRRVDPFCWLPHLEIRDGLTNCELIEDLIFHSQGHHRRRSLHHCCCHRRRLHIPMQDYQRFGC